MSRSTVKSTADARTGRTALFAVGWRRDSRRLDRLMVGVGTLHAGLLTLALLLTTTPASAQVALLPPGQLARIDAKTQAAILDSVCTVMDTMYVVRDTDETVQSWTLDVVPGKRLTDIPVYVLASDRTASAAEEFTFDLQHLKRATIVGDTTAGAGHTVNNVFIHFPNFRVGMRVPYGHAIDPKTKRGWEGVGVIPDIAVASDDALIAAQKDALERLREKCKTPEDSTHLAWTVADLEAQLHPITLTETQLKEFEGKYGPRRIFLEGGVLQYQREGRPAYAISPMGKDLFRVGDLDYFRLRFEQDASGRVTGLTGVYSDGHEEGNQREG